MGARFSLTKILVPVWKLLWKLRLSLPNFNGLFSLVKIIGHNAIQIPININQLNLDNLLNIPISYDKHFMAENVTLPIKN